MGPGLSHMCGRPHLDFAAASQVGCAYTVRQLTGPNNLNAISDLIFRLSQSTSGPHHLPMYYEAEVSDRPPYLLVYGSEEALSARLDRLYRVEGNQKHSFTLAYRVRRFFRVMRGFHEVRVPPPTFTY